jgi:DNA repair exonuclease SbcCD ATPase subunit
MIEEYKKRLAKEIAQRDLLKEHIIKEKANLEKYEEDLKTGTKARAIVQTVAEQVQKKLEYHISNLVSMALASVWEDPYKFSINFVQRRNKTECDLIFSKNGKETDDIVNSGGGGVCDIVSNIALPVALWSIKKSRNVMIWDEPTKFLHNPTYQEKASEMIKKLSEELRLQIIMVTDQQNLLNAADKVITVEQKNGESKVSP